MKKKYYIYIMTNKVNTVTYIGVTNNLQRRVQEHKEKKIKGFSLKYNLDKLIYFEEYYSAYNAISREKQIKRWRRYKKDYLINIINPKRNDLSKELF